jgi:large subunit ribosomal protein L29
MENEEIRDLSPEDLTDKIQDVQAMLNKMRMDHTVSELENPMSVRHTRRLLARLKTEENSRKLQLN